MRSSINAGGLMVTAAMLCASGLACAAGAEKTDEAGIAVKVGYDHTVGKYGLLRDSTADTTSFTATYDTDNYSLDLLIPYVKQTGPGRLQIIVGQRGGIVVVSGPAQVARGIGDVTAGINRYVLNEEDHGIEIRDVANDGATLRRTLHERSQRALDGDDIDAIVQVGTNLSMLDLCAAAEQVLGKPVISINAATWWHGLRAVGVEDKVWGKGRLLEAY